MNSSAKGSRMEKLCLEEIVGYIALHYGRDAIIDATWKAVRSRAGGNDFLDCWDCAVLWHSNGYERDLFLVQVKSTYRPYMLKDLQKGVIGYYCYLAVYGRVTQGVEVAIKLPHFNLVRVQ